MSQKNTAPAPSEARAAIRDLQKRTGLPIAVIARKTQTPHTTLRHWATDKNVVPREAQWNAFWAAASRLPTKNGRK